MKGNKRYNIVIIILVLTTIVVSVKYINMKQKYSDQQEKADSLFRSSLGIAAGGFAVDYDKVTDDNEKQFRYNQALAYVVSASQIVDLTTYDRGNRNFNLALSNLSNVMEQNEYKANIIKRSKDLFDIFSRLALDPLDDGQIEKLDKLAEDIRAGR